MSIKVTPLTAGTNNFQTTAEAVAAVATDFVSPGVVGAITSTAGIAPMTGAFAVNAQATPDTTVKVTAGTGYVRATPSTQASQVLRFVMDADQNLTISPNTSGSTKYDWIYLKVDPTLANTPDASGTTVGTVVASRSSSNTVDNGTPPTYGYLIAIVSVANSFVTITNGTITDKRGQTGPVPAINLYATSTSAVSGTLPAGGLFKIQAGTTVVATNSNADGTATFPTAFPGGLLTVVACDGDDSGAANFSIIQSASNSSAFSFSCAKASTNVRVNWIAIGW